MASHCPQGSPGAELLDDTQDPTHLASQLPGPQPIDPGQISRSCQSPFPPQPGRHQSDLGAAGQDPRSSYAQLVAHPAWQQRPFFQRRPCQPVLGCAGESGTHSGAMSSREGPIEAWLPPGVAHLKQPQGPSLLQGRLVTWSLPASLQPSPLSRASRRAIILWKCHRCEWLPCGWGAQALVVFDHLTPAHPHPSH